MSRSDNPPSSGSPDKLNDLPALMTSDEVATFLRMREYTVRKMARDGTWPASKVGNAWLFRQDFVMSLAPPPAG